MSEKMISEEPRCTDLYHGVYVNYNFMNVVTRYIGHVVKLCTVSGNVFEGIFRTFSPDFQVVLELVHEVNSSLAFDVLRDSFFEKMIFSPIDIDIIEIIDVEIDGGQEVFLNDREIAKLSSNEASKVREKILEPWDCSEESSDLCELGLSGRGGWNPKEMFEKNEQLYGVTSDFDDGLSLYTLPLPQQETDTKKLNASKQNDKAHVPTPHGPKNDSGKTNKKSKVLRKPQPSNSNSLDSVQKNNQAFKTITKKEQPNSRLPINTFKVERKSQNSSDPPSVRKNSFTATEDKLTNINGDFLPPTSSHSMKFKLNPYAKEFVPTTPRPAFPCVPVQPTAYCPGPIYSPTPFFTSSLQFQTTFYAWKPAVMYTNNFPI